MLTSPREALCALALSAAFMGVSQAEADGFGPPPPQNPGTAPTGLATQHGDSAASDTTPLPGPGAHRVSVQQVPLGAVCPSVLMGSDQYPIAVCTKLANQTPYVFLLHPVTGLPLATMKLAKGELFGGVYPYLDEHDRVVVVDGAHNLLRIGHHQGPLGIWQLTVESSIPLAAAVTGSCGSASCDSVVGFAAGYDSQVWFATSRGTVGVVHPTTQAIATVALPSGERVDNSIATAPQGTAVVTDHALYLLGLDASGAPQIVWRAPYDRGPARKPGQLSQGSGSTPTFFGPQSGTEYLAITDNASPLEHLLVYHTASPVPVCATTLPSPTGLGTENSPIGSGRSVVVASTYGYPYPATPAHAGPSVPASAPISGGMTRVDLAPDGSGCSVVWSNQVRSAAVPKLSLADALIYTLERHPSLLGAPGGAGDTYHYTVIAPDTGLTAAQQLIGATTAHDTLQLAGTLAPGGVIYQGTVTGIARIAAAP